VSRKRAIMDALIAAGQQPTSIREAALLDAAKAEGVTPPGSMSDAAWADAAKLWSPTQPMMLREGEGEQPPPEDPPVP
jgi:hypothetical protein